MSGLLKWNPQYVHLKFSGGKKFLAEFLATPYNIDLRLVKWTWNVYIYLYWDKFKYLCMYGVAYRVLCSEANGKFINKAHHEGYACVTGLFPVISLFVRGCVWMLTQAKLHSI